MLERFYRVPGTPGTGSGLGLAIVREIAASHAREHVHRRWRGWRLQSWDNISAMDSVDIEVLRTAEAWRKSGHKVALGTIVKTWGSAPRPIGAMVAVRDDGQVVGSVSGGCVEDDLIDKVKAKLAGWKKPELFTYGVTNEEATRWGLPCGGTLQLVMEPLSDASGVQELLQRISSAAAGEAAARDGQRQRRRSSPGAGRTCSSSTAGCSPRCTARAGAWC